jgi:hypothetical protein
MQLVLRLIPTNCMPATVSWLRIFITAELLFARSWCLFEPNCCRTENAVAAQQQNAHAFSENA